jgi:hypothetical protein
MCDGQKLINIGLSNKKYSAHIKSHFENANIKFPDAEAHLSC